VSVKASYGKTSAAGGDKKGAPELAGWGERPRPPKLNGAGSAEAHRAKAEGGSETHRGDRDMRWITLGLNPFLRTAR
jgi:hypothetical protein